MSILKNKIVLTRNSRSKIYRKMISKGGMQMIGIKSIEPLYGEDADRILKQASQPISKEKS